MDPAQVGLWAGAVLGVAGVARLAVGVFVKAVGLAIGEQIEGLRDRLDQDEEFWTRRLAALEDRLARIDAELRPNGGASLRDTVDRLEARLCRE